MLTLDEIRNLAVLAKLDFLDDEKLKKIQSQLNNIFTYIDQLKTVEIDESVDNDFINIEKNRFQDESIEKSTDFDIESFIKRSPKNNGKYIITNKVLAES